MADKTILGLTEATALAAGDLFEIENTGGNSRRITADNIKNFVNPSRYEAAAAAIPVLTDFTWVNQGTCVATDTATGISVSVDIDNEQHILLANDAPPSAPYDLYMRVEMVNAATAVTTGSIILCGIVLRDNSNQDFIVAQVSDFRVSGDEQNLYRYSFQRCTNPTTIGAEVSVVYVAQAVKWLRANVTSTDVTLYGSPDGITWIEMGSESIATFVGTITGVGFGVRTVGCSHAHIVVNSFGYVAPTV